MDTTQVLSPIPKAPHRVSQRIFAIALGIVYSFLAIYTVYTVTALANSGINFPTTNWSSQSREILASVVNILVFVISISIFLFFMLFGNRWFNVLIRHRLMPIIMKYTFISTLVLFITFGILMKFRMPGLDATSYVIGRGFPSAWSFASEHTGLMEDFSYANIVVNFVYWLLVSLLVCAIFITIKYRHT